MASNDFYMHRVKSVKIELLPPQNLRKIWYEKNFKTFDYQSYFEFFNRI